MSDLVFIAFDNEKQAEEVRDKALAIQREYLIEVDDAVVVTRDQKWPGQAQSTHASNRGRVSGRSLLGQAESVNEKLINNLCTCRPVAFE
jgi:uncharacterized membrane protein